MPVFNCSVKAAQLLLPPRKIGGSRCIRSASRRWGEVATASYSCHETRTPGSGGAHGVAGPATCTMCCYSRAADVALIWYRVLPVCACMCGKPRCRMGNPDRPPSPVQTRTAVGTSRALPDSFFRPQGAGLPWADSRPWPFIRMRTARQCCYCTRQPKCKSNRAPGQGCLLVRSGITAVPC